MPPLNFNLGGRAHREKSGKYCSSDLVSHDVSEIELRPIATNCDNQQAFHQIYVGDSPSIRNGSSNITLQRYTIVTEWVS